MKKLIPFFLLLISCTSNSLDETLIGQWKVTRCEYFDPKGVNSGLMQEYYKLYSGEIRIFENGRTKWKKAKNFIDFALNENDSILKFKTDTLKLIKLTSDTLIIRDKFKGQLLFTTFVRVN